MEHDDCPRNYRTGSSKAMEASAALVLMLQLDSLGIAVEYVVSNDDSTMRAHLRHIGKETRSYRFISLSRKSCVILPTVSR